MPGLLAADRGSLLRIALIYESCRPQGGSSVSAARRYAMAPKIIGRDGAIRTRRMNRPLEVIDQGRNIAVTASTPNWLLDNLRPTPPQPARNSAPSAIAFP